MNLNINNIIATEEYNFLRSEPHLGKNILFLTFGGSHAYGTNIETSDIDIRGVATRSKREILLGRGFEQVLDNVTDTTIYAFDKLIPLLTNVNPNTIEMLGCKPEHYIIKHPLGQMLIDNASLFLSKKCVYSFGGYANAQLQRLNNKASRSVPLAEREQHIIDTIENAKYSFPYRNLSDNEYIKLYVNNDEICTDINLNGYPLRDFRGMMSEIGNIVTDFDKNNHRNTAAIEHGKLGKHMLHLVRLFLMCFDILEDGKIITYREKDHDLLMDIRNGKYLDANNQPTKEFMDMVNELKNRLDYLKEHSPLPKNPDYKKIDDFVIQAHEMILSED